MTAADSDTLIATLRTEAADLRIELIRTREKLIEAGEELETEGESKHKLLREISRLSLALEASRTDLAQMTTNLTETQKRCTDLFQQVREYRQRGLMLPSWTCERCGCFNGEAKEDKIECRACGLPAPEGTSAPPPPKKTPPETDSEEQYLKAPTSDDPVAQTANGLWWFFTETWAEMHGPYAEEMDARVMFRRYCDEVIGPAKEAS